jgi:hypothetical protein
LMHGTKINIIHALFEVLVFQIIKNNGLT